MTAGFIVWLIKLSFHGSDGQRAMMVLFYFATVTMWMVGSFSLAKAKGHSADSMGAVFIFLIIFGLCIPIAPFVFPGFVIFGLEDKTRERSRGF